MANNVTLSYPSSFYHQFFDRNGKPLAGGKLYTYIAGSSTSVVTYKTIGGGTESANMNTNPIILNISGMAELVISTNIAYKFILFDKNDVKIDEWDNVTAGGSEGGGSSNVYVEGTSGEIDVHEESVGLIRRFIVSLSDSIKNAISDLSSSVNDIINALYNKKDKQQPVTKLGSNTKVPVSFNQDANGELDIEFDDIAFPDWTTAINNAVANCEKLSNKKNSVTGYESSTNAYPSIKAVVDLVNNIMQNLGGKLITDNGEPFSNSNDLPSTTPYQGVTIADKDYAYVQGTGYAERWSASVSGSDVAWVQEYSINIPVFTPAQQAAIDSGVTSTKIGNYDSHIANTTIHVTSTEKNTWNAKQNAISDLSEIRSGASAGATALQPNGNGSNVTSTFTAASSRTNISSGEKLSTIFGKIAKWFADLKAVAFSGSYSDLSDKPTIPAAAKNGVLTIKQNGTSKGTFSANQSSNTEINVTDTTYESKSAASGGTALSLVTTGDKYNWNAKQNALPTSGSASNTYAINISGSANSVAPDEARYNTNKNWLKVGTFVSSLPNTMFKGVTFSVEYRANDSNTQSGLLWISAGEHKSSGEYGNDDIVAEYLTIGRRTNTLTDDVKFYVKYLGTSSTSGVEIYAYLYNYSELSITPLNVPEGSYTPEMTYVNDEPTGKKEVTYSMLLRSPYGTAKGSSTNPVYIDDKGNVQPCDTTNMSVGGANSAWYAATAGDSIFASKVGSSSSHHAIGGQYLPIYVDSDGNIQECLPISYWSVGEARVANHSTKLYATSYGGSNVPFCLKADGSGFGDASPSFKIPHTVAKWHQEINNGTITGIVVTHYTSKFVNGPSSDLFLGLITPSTNILQLTLDARTGRPWNGGQVWGTIKWDSQTGSNLTSSVERIGDANMSGDVVLSSRNLSVSNVQDIQGHAIFAVCTGNNSNRYVIDMEISVIKPQANSTLCYITIMSKCFEDELF